MNKTVVITGASRGIGLSLCRFYQQAGWNVYAICRKPTPELIDLGVAVIDGVDVGDDQSLSTIETSLRYIPIDLLINNAGMWGDEWIGNMDLGSIRRQFEVNALAPLKITDSLLPNMGPGAKIAMITSRMGSIADNASGGRYGYRMSKAALNIAAVSLARDLYEENIAVAVLHPGLVGTDMIGGIGDITPDEAAERLARRIEELSLESSGQFFHSDGSSLPW